MEKKELEEEQIEEKEKEVEEKNKKTSKEKSKNKKEKKVKKENSAKKKITKKNLIIIGASVVSIIIVCVIFIIFVLPIINYNIATSKYEKKDYKAAVRLYEKLEDYKDSSKKLDKAYFEYGKQLIKKEKFAEALKNLEKTKVEAAKEYVEYATALKNMEEGNYDVAIDSLKNMKDFEKANEYQKQAYYLKASKQFKEKSYSAAKSNFEKADDYKDAKEKKYTCDFIVAEEYYKDGELYKAKQLYESLPKEYEYNKIKVSDRMATLTEYNDFVNLSGEYYGKAGGMAVRQIWDYDGSWEEWTGEYSESASVKCKIQEDGTVKISGTASFYTYTRYSSLSTGLYPKSFDVPFSMTVKKGEALPNSLMNGYPAVISKSGTAGHANVTYANGMLYLSFELYDENYSSNFTYKYLSNITYVKQ